MDWEPIRKHTRPGVDFNLADYGRGVREFSWDIKSAGHLIGPFEVESLLMEHPAVAEAGVIGKPDPVAGEIVKAFVALNPGHEPSQELRRELIAFARRRLGGLAPKEIEFDQNLPLTPSGKIMHRLLKARELGLETGDVSTLDGAP